MTDDIHPEVAAPLTDARRLVSIMDDQLHKMNSATFIAADDSETVEVTLNGHRQLTGVAIRDGLLRLGAETVEQRLNEALRNATDAASASMVADQKRIDELLDHLTDA